LLLLGSLDGIPDQDAADSADAGTDEGAGSSMSSLASDDGPGSGPDGSAGDGPLFTGRHGS
jgi:hypothetical protein